MQASVCIFIQATQLSRQSQPKWELSLPCSIVWKTKAMVKLNLEQWWLNDSTRRSRLLPPWVSSPIKTYGHLIRLLIRCPVLTDWLGY